MQAGLNEVCPAFFICCFLPDTLRALRLRSGHALSGLYSYDLQVFGHPAIYAFDVLEKAAMRPAMGKSIWRNVYDAEIHLI